MPELPEVETVVRDLQKKIVGRRILSVWCDWPKMIKDYEKQDRARVSAKAVNDFKKQAVGLVVERVERRAKNILIYLSADHLMLVHQKMTGHFLVGKWETKSGKAMGVSPRAIIDDSYNHYVHLIFDLSPVRHSKQSEERAAIQLGLSDVRKFAKVVFGPREKIEALPELANLGPDALSPALDTTKFSKIILNEMRPIKQVLMDPCVVAGIGNIYSDEILWRARVHPKRSAKSLSKKELTAMFTAMREVLDKAVELRGTSTSDFRDTAGERGGFTDYRHVYQRTGEPCARCKAPIARMIIGGRSAHHCLACQK